jgi:hypothetical protein
MDVVDSRFAREKAVQVSYYRTGAEEDAGMGMPTYRDVGSAGCCLEQQRPTYGSHDVTDTRGNCRSGSS